MSRKDTLNALFGLRPGEASAPETKADPLGVPNEMRVAQGADLAVSSERVRAGAVGAMGASLREISREVEDMRQRLASGEQVVEIDPELIDPAPFADRLVIDVDPAFAALVASIRDSGQQVPALVRLHPSRPGRFQTAYGHRRIRACLALGRPVRAVVRVLDDAALAVAQGQENIARRDLSFIEKAVFAQGLEAAGLPRSEILKALATDKGDLSRYIAVAKAVPIELARAIGPAPKAGRARWLALVEALAAAGWEHAKRSGKLPDRVLATLEKSAFAGADSDARFGMVLMALSTALPKPAPVLPEPLDIRDGEGELIARLFRNGESEGREASSITIVGGNPPKNGVPGFATFLAREIPGLFSRWKAGADEDPAMTQPETRGE
jgi:ParB family chromosome partitioning protein